MFVGCSSLKELNLSNFNTKNVEKMNNILNMFVGCSEELKKQIKEKYKNIKEDAFFDLNLL